MWYCVFVRLAFCRAVALAVDLNFGPLNELWFRIKTLLGS